MPKERILIVEDEQVIAFIIQKRLLQFGYEVLSVASTAGEAIRFARELNPDLILMDIHIRGEKDGIEAAQEIRKFSEAPVIYLTAYSDSDTLDRAKMTEPAGFLIKPINERELFTNVVLALHKSEINKRLKESEQRYNALFSHSLDCIYLIDLDGKVLDINRSALMLTGYKKEEALEINIMDVVHPDELSDLRLLFKELKTGGIRSGHGIYSIRTKQNKFLKFETNYSILLRDEIPYAVQGIARDITKSKEVEEELRKLSVVVEQSPVSIIITDVNANIEYVNPKFTEVSGYSLEEVFGKNPRFLKSGYTPATDYMKMWDMISKGLEWRGEFHNKKKSGELYWESATVAPIKDGGGKITHFIALKQETTGVKIVEKSLIESEDRYRRLVEMSPDMVAIQSGGKFVYANEASFCLLNAESKEDLLGKDLLNFVHPDYHQVILDRINFIIENKMIAPFVEEKFVDVKGDVIDVEIAAIPTTYKGKSAVQIIARNISQRKKAEQALKQSEERFRTVFENSPVGIAISMGKIILQVNKAFLKMFGLDAPSDALGKNILEMVAPKYREIITVNLEMRTENQGIASHHEIYGLRKDGSKFPIYAELDYLKLSEGTAAIALITDITELMAREEQIKSSLREKEILLKEIHHRVKNNLQIISSLLSLQSEYIDDRKSLSLFNDSRNRVKSMALIHERLYQSSDLGRIDFSEYINELVGFLYRTYMEDSRSVKVTVDSESIFLAIDTAIPCGLIINELVSNAMKYAFAGVNEGLISISFKVEPSREYVLVLSDNGIGIPSEINFRETSSLGLQLVNNLVDQLKGTIELNTEKGTKFVIRFPIR